MFRLLLAVLIILPNYSKAQIPQRENSIDSLGNRVGDWILYYDSTFNILPENDTATYYRLVTFENDKPKGKVKDYFMNGILQWEGYMLSVEPDTLHGDAIQYYPLGNVYQKYTTDHNKVNGKIETYYENGTLQFTGNYLNDVPEGEAVFYHPNGKLKSRGSYRNGELDGPWEYFYDTGKQENKIFYKNGLMHGNYLAYYPNGILKEESHLVEGKLDGSYKSNYENGRPHEIGTYRNSKQDGYFEFYFENGQLASKGIIKENIYEGDWVFFFPNGNKKSHGFYKNDMEEGRWVFYYENGNKKQEGPMENGKYHGEVIFYSDEGYKASEGKILKGNYEGKWFGYFADGSRFNSVYFKNDLRNGPYEEYYSDGQLKAKGNYINDKKDQAWEWYYENGQILERSQFKLDSLHGTFETWYENGNRKVVGFYQDDEPNGDFEYFFESGAEKSGGKYINGKRDGKWTFYFENGNIRSTGNYLNGATTGHWQYYNESGWLSREGREEDEKSQGIWKYYYSNGQLRQIGNSINGKADGIWTQYDSLGVKQSEGSWRNGLKEGWWIYYDSLGNKKEEGLFKKDRAEGDWIVYENGKKKLEPYHQGKLLNFSNLRDSAFALAERRSIDSAWMVARAARKAFRRDNTADELGKNALLTMKGSIYWFYDDEKALKVYQKALDRIEKEEGIKSYEYAVALNDIAFLFYRKDDFKASSEYFQKSFQTIFGKEEYIRDYVVSFRWWIYSINHLNQEQRALDSLMSLQSYLQKNHPDRKDLIVELMYSNVELTYDNNRYNESIQSSKDLIKYIQENDLESHFSFPLSYLKMGQSYFEISQYDSAKNSYFKSLAAFRQKRDTLDIDFFNVFGNLFNVYYNEDNLDSASYVNSIRISKLEQHGFTDESAYEVALINRAKVFRQLSQYREALEADQKALSVILSKSFINRNNATIVYQGLGLSQQELFPDNLSLAEESYLKALEYASGGSEFSYRYYNTLLMLATFYNHEVADFPKTKEKLELAQTYLEQYNITEPVRLGRLFRRWADYYRSVESFDEALENYDKSLEHYSKVLDLYIESYCWTLMSKAYTYLDLMDVDNALNATLLSLQTFKERRGTNNIDYASLLTELARIYSTKGQEKRAIILMGESLQTIKELLGESNYKYYQYLIVQASYYRDDEAYEESLKNLNKALQLREEYGHPKDLMYVYIFNVMGEVYSYRNEFELAEKNLQQMVREARAMVGESMDYSYYLKEISIFYLDWSKPELAQKYIENSLRIIERNLGNQTLEYGTYLRELVRAYQQKGDYVKALQLAELSEQILRNFMEGRMDHIKAQQRLAGLYLDLGRYEESEKLYKEAINWIEVTYGKDYYTYASAYRDLSNLYYWQDKFEEALAAIDSAIISLDLNEYVENDWYFDYNSNRGSLLGEMGRYEEALEILTTTYQEANEFYDNDQTYTSKYARALAHLYMKIGKYKEAEELFLMQEDIYMARDYTNLLSKVNYMDNLAALYMAWGKFGDAKKYWTEITSIISSRILADFPYLSESEKANFWYRYRSNYEYFNSYAIKAGPEDPSSYNLMYDNQLLTKSILLGTTTKDRNRILNSGDSTLVSIYFEYLGLKENLADYYAYTTEQLEEEGVNIDSLESLAEGYERSLSLNASNISKEERERKIRWRDIQRSLGENEAAIEIIRFRYFNVVPTDSVMYAALILTSDTRRNPDLVILPNGNELETKFINSYLNNIRFRSEDGQSFSSFWQKIHEKVKDKEVVWLSPDGVFNQININTLSIADNRYVIDEYEIKIVTSTRDVLAYKSGPKGGSISSTASLFGFPKYSLDHETIIAKVDTRKNSNSFSLERDLDLERFGMSELPGTKVEVEGISDILSNGDWQVQLYMAEEALEENVKLVESPGVLHIATHGFFLDNRQAAKANIRSLGDSVVYKENPLLRAGLLFAGAAETITGDYPDNIEDGIFTAYEAMNLNLNETDLVVLSACETGRGEIKTGEGVFGLQRAFQVAGTKALIMSLWKVNDEATQLLMTHFYRNWSKGLSKSDAFRSAQMEVRNRFNHPYFWGAFIMIGQ